VDVIVLIGRILFAALFVSSGVAHVLQREAMAGYATARRVPSALPAVLVSGVMILLGGLGVLLGIWADLGALLIAAFLIPTAVLMHRFWGETDPATRQLEQIQFMKDIALAGAALALFAFFAYAGADLGLTITGPLFDLD
jgi:putative oxidoreductase